MLQAAPRPTNEAKRLAVLRELDLFDTQDDLIYRRKVDIMRRVFHTNIALMALAEADEQRFKVAFGLPMHTVARDLAICSHALLPPFVPLVIPDTTADDRSRHSPMVTGELGIRFYAGAPLVLDGEFAVGTLCIMDTTPRTLDADEIKLLEDFAVQLSAVMQARLDTLRLQAKQRAFARLGLEHEIILQTAAIGIIRIDSIGSIEAFNPAAEHLFGYTADEVRGKNVSMLMPEPWRSAHDGYLMQYLATGKAKVIGSGREVLGLRKNGETFPFQLAVSELTIEGRHSFIGFVTDLSAQKQAEAEMQTLQEIHRRGEIFARQGAWSLDLSNGQMSISEGFAELFGFAPGTRQIAHGEIRARTNPAYHAQVNQVLITAKATHQSFRFEYPYQKTPDSPARWFRTLGNVITNEQGEAVTLAGVTQDVTEEHEANTLVEQQKQLLMGLNEAVQAFLGQTDAQAVWDALLDQLLKITGAEFGFLGEVRHDQGAHPCLKIHAITNLSWSAESDALYERVMAGNMMFCNPGNLIGAVMQSREPIVATEVRTDPRRGGFPPGHPLLDNYLGIPLFREDELIGVVAIGNRAEGVSQALTESLAPFLSTYTMLIVSLRQRQAQQSFEAQLIASKEQADRANQSKSQFLSSMSHELRTPLNAILGFTQLMSASRREPLSERQRGFIAHIDKAGQHLLSLVNDVLNLAKIEAGEITLSPEPLELSAIAHEVCEMLADKAREQQVSLQCTLAAALRVCADLTRTRQVLINLISNAIKYNRPGGTVTLTALDPTNDETSGLQLTGIVVADSGIGIPARLQHRLFRAFERLGQETGSIEGTGIGLMITKELIERMKGRLTFESVEGEGSRFFVQLPAYQPVVQEHCGSANDAATREVTEAALAAIPAANTPLVLYIEDNAANSTLMAEIVAERDDVRLLLAADAEHGLELAVQHLPQLILMDINLPGMSGQQAAARLKKWQETASIPIVALSADATAPMRRQAEQSGLFDRDLTKPFNLGEINALFDELCARNGPD